MLLCATVVAGLGAHVLLPESIGSDVVGDVLYAVAVFLALVVCAPRASSWRVGLVALAWCVTVELFQLTGVPAMLAASFRPAALLLGGTFDPRDLMIAVVVPLAAGSIDGLVRRSSRLEL